MRFKSLLLFVTVLVLAYAGIPTPTASAATRFVLFEEATQWNCPPCSQLNPLLEDFCKQNSSTMICIRYHGWWPGQNNDPMFLFDQTLHQGRINYYAINSEPATWIDGTYHHEGYSSAFISQFKSEMNTRLAKTTPLGLTVTEAVNGSTVTVTVTATSTSALSSYKLRVALVQNLVNDVQGGTNGETEWENVVRKMLPDYNGSDFSINANQTKTMTFTYNTADVPDPSNTFAVVWVQNDANKEVINSATDAANVLVSQRGPSMIVGAPGSTSAFTAVAHNASTVPLDVTASLDQGVLPLNWTTTYSIGGTTYTDPHTWTIAPGDSSAVTVNVQMTGGLGINTPTLSLAAAGRHSSAGGSLISFASVSNDLPTVILDANGGKGRELIYQTLMSDMQKPSGVIHSNYTSQLLQQDPAITTIIYVGGENYPSDADVSALTTFMNKGGKLLLTGDVIGTQFSLSGSTIGQLFMQNMLHTTTIQESGAFRGYAGVNDPSGIGQGQSCGVRTVLSGASDGMRYWPDAIKAKDSKASVFAKFAGVDTACGVAITGTAYKAVYMTFPLEAMDDNNTQSLTFTRIWNWLNAAVAKSLQVNSPTTQTVWQQGSVQQITWTVTGVSTVKLSYSLDGTNYTVITSSADASKGAYNWTIPSVQNTTTAYVRVEDATTGNPVSTAGPFTINDNSGVDEHSIVSDFRIEQNYPNPFATSTVFTFDLPRAERVALKVYDLKGALVTTVFDENRQSGSQSVSFDASTLPTGTYEYRMITPTGTVTRTMTLVKQ